MPPEPILKCTTCHGDVVGVRTEGVIDQSDGARPGIVYACRCGRKTIEPIDQVDVVDQVDKPELHSNGWTASRSECSGDVDAR